MCNNPVRRRDELNNIVTRPCGNCLGCRIDKLILWQGRCTSEYIKSRSAFVTLTYDDNHLFYKDNAVFPSLDKKAFTSFVDGLRHYVKRIGVPDGCSKDFKYLGVGEYGDSFNRPHYHVLFFGLDFHDCSKYFSKVWQNGFVKTLPLLSGGVRYVLDYMFKNLSGDLAIENYDSKGLERPFFSVSSKFGYDYFFAHRDEICKYGYIFSGSRRIPVPVYYKNMFMSFSDSEVATLEYNMYQDFLSRSAEVKRQGFSDYVGYMDYQRKVNEDSLASRFRSKGIPVLNYYKDCLGSNSKELLRQIIEVSHDY